MITDKKTLREEIHFSDDNYKILQFSAWVCRTQIQASSLKRGKTLITQCSCDLLRRCLEFFLDKSENEEKQK